MLWTLLAMLLILVVAGGVVLYVAYPHRGEDVPGAPWLGEAMKRGVEALPALPDELQGHGQDQRQDQRQDQSAGA